MSALPSITQEAMEAAEFQVSRPQFRASQVTEYSFAPWSERSRPLETKASHNSKGQLIPSSFVCQEMTLNKWEQWPV